MLPNFMVVGAAKSGTTSLYHLLGQHPQIYMSPEKEPEYFSFINEAPDFLGPGNRPMNGGIITDTAEYLALFEGVTGEKAVGECSTSYLFLPQAAANIHSSLPHCRIIIILRQPAERTYSHYMDHVMSLNEELSFEQALAAEPERQAQNWRWGYQYSGHSRYYQQVKRYYDRFGKENVLVCLFERLQSDPQKLMADIYSFLGVADDFLPKVGAVHNPSGRPRGMWLQQFLMESNLLKTGLKRLVPSPLRRNLRRWLLKTNLQKTALDPHMRHRLMELYREDVLALQDLIGQDLSQWLV